MRITIYPFLSVLLLLAGPAHADEAGPSLRRQGDAVQLIVKGRPFLIRGGELGNSSGEPDYLRPFWPKLKTLNLNAVAAPVYWNLIEPAEGKFDFSAVDALLADARANDLRIVLLWFGVWKNSMSTYVPDWVKRDSRRFPHSRDSAGRSIEILSPFYPETRQADAKAFRALLRHLREVDGKDQTVVLVQVENEIGMIPEARDRSEAAEREFRQPVPTGLLDYLAGQAERMAPELRDRWLAAGRKTAGTWTEVFGGDVWTDEIFMAWHFARFIETLAAQGKAEYPLPMYVNAALARPGHKPGQYPSAGPLPHLFDIWRAGAPSIDFPAPDIYSPSFAEWVRKYARAGEPLFIPEAQRSAEAAVNGLYAMGQHNAIGFCPFTIETIPEPAAKFLGDSNDLVRQLEPLILAHQGLGTMAGLLPDGPEQRQPQQVWLGGCILQVSFEKVAGPAYADGAAATVASAPLLPAGGLVIATAPDEFLIGGIGITTTFQLREPGGPEVGLLSVEEGQFVDGKWTHLRWLNGDQTHQGRHVRIEPGRFAILKVKLYRYR